MSLPVYFGWGYSWVPGFVLLLLSYTHKFVYLLFLNLISPFFHINNNNKKKFKNVLTETKFPPAVSLPKWPEEPGTGQGQNLDPKTQRRHPTRMAEPQSQGPSSLPPVSAAARSYSKVTAGKRLRASSAGHHLSTELQGLQCGTPPLH